MANKAKKKRKTAQSTDPNTDPQFNTEVNWAAAAIRVMGRRPDVREAINQLRQTDTTMGWLPDLSPPQQTASNECVRCDEPDPSGELLSLPCEDHCHATCLVNWAFGIGNGTLTGTKCPSCSEDLSRLLQALDDPPAPLGGKRNPKPYSQGACAFCALQGADERDLPWRDLPCGDQSHSSCLLTWVHGRNNGSLLDPRCGSCSEDLSEFVRTFAEPAPPSQNSEACGLCRDRVHDQTRLGEKKQAECGHYYHTGCLHGWRASLRTGRGIEARCLICDAVLALFIQDEGSQEGSQNTTAQTAKATNNQISSQIQPQEEARVERPAQLDQPKPQPTNTVTSTQDLQQAQSNTNGNGTANSGDKADAPPTASQVAAETITDNRSCCCCHSIPLAQQHQGDQQPREHQQMSCDHRLCETCAIARVKQYNMGSATALICSALTDDTRCMTDISPELGSLMAGAFQHRLLVPHDDPTKLRLKCIECKQTQPNYQVWYMDRCLHIYCKDCLAAKHEAMLKTEPGQPADFPECSAMQCTARLCFVLPKLVELKIISEDSDRPPELFQSLKELRGRPQSVRDETRTRLERMWRVYSLSIRQARQWQYSTGDLELLGKSFETAEQLYRGCNVRNAFTSFEDLQRQCFSLVPDKVASRMGVGEDDPLGDLDSSDSLQWLVTYCSDIDLEANMNARRELFACYQITRIVKARSDRSRGLTVDSIIKSIVDVEDSDCRGRMSEKQRRESTTKWKARHVSGLRLKPLLDAFGVGLLLFLPSMMTHSKVTKWAKEITIILTHMLQLRNTRTANETIQLASDCTNYCSFLFNSHDVPGMVQEIGKILLLMTIRREFVVGHKIVITPEVIEEIKKIPKLPTYKIGSIQFDESDLDSWDANNVVTSAAIGAALHAMLQTEDNFEIDRYWHVSPLIEFQQTVNDEGVEVCNFEPKPTLDPMDRALIPVFRENDRKHSEWCLITYDQTKVECLFFNPRSQIFAVKIAGYVISYLENHFPAVNATITGGIGEDHAPDITRTSNPLEEGMAMLNEIRRRTSECQSKHADKAMRMQKDYAAFRTEAKLQSAQVYIDTAMAEARERHETREHEIRERRMAGKVAAIEC